MGLALAIIAFYNNIVSRSVENHKQKVFFFEYKRAYNFKYVKLAISKNDFEFRERKSIE